MHAVSVDEQEVAATTRPKKRRRYDNGRSAVESMSPQTSLEIEEIVS
jgi:hypothetical protein